MMSVLNQKKVEEGIELRIEHLTDMQGALGSLPAAKKNADPQNVTSHFH